MALLNAIEFFFEFFYFYNDIVISSPTSFHHKSL